MKSYLFVMGRQPKLGLAELQSRFGIDSARLLNEQVALLETALPVDIAFLGGAVKVAELVTRTAGSGWMGAGKHAVKWLENELSRTSGKVTLGISAYGFDIGPRDVGKTGLIVKARLKNRSGSVRLVPNDVPALSSAQTYHNKFGTSPLKRELIIVSGTDGHCYLGDVTGVQDIDAYTLRDRGRPKRDALNGMLPPKLAQIMVNLGAKDAANVRVLDPFCGTGVVLMEAALMGHPVYGTDVNERMVAFSRDNLNWLKDVGHVSFDWYLHKADATDATWQKPVDAVVCESYLGEPMAQEPTPEKLAKVMEKCEDVIRGFLVNIAPQLESGTRLCVAVPAWRINNQVKHLPVVDDLKDLGYNWTEFKGVERSDLIYYREDQVVARELLVVSKA